MMKLTKAMRIFATQLKLWWQWSRVPIISNSVTMLFTAIEATPALERARILICIAYIRNEIYRGTGYDLLECARDLKGNKDDLAIVVKALWLSQNSYTPYQRALTIWFCSIKSQQAMHDCELCAVWEMLAGSTKYIEKVMPRVSAKLGMTANYEGLGQIPKGICL